MKWTFGGLDRSYYFRQLFFGLIMSGVLLWLLSKVTEIPPGAVAVVGINSLLYPYSRFVWEGIVSFLLGDNIFFIPALFMLIGKVVTMIVCLKMAVFIAPIGLIWLYWHHSRRFALQQ